MNDQTIGVVATGEIAVGLVKGYQLVGKLRVYPPVRNDDDESLAPDGIHSMPMEAIAETIAQNIQDLCDEHDASPSPAVGIGFPWHYQSRRDHRRLAQSETGKRREAWPNCSRQHCMGHGMDLPVSVFNDADVTAAGIAATAASWKI